MHTLFLLNLWGRTRTGPRSGFEAYGCLHARQWWVVPLEALLRTKPSQLLNCFRAQWLIKQGTLGLWDCGTLGKACKCHYYAPNAQKMSTKQSTVCSFKKRWVYRRCADFYRQHMEREIVQLDWQLRKKITLRVTWTRRGKKSTRQIWHQICQISQVLVLVLVVFFFSSTSYKNATLSNLTVTKRGWRRWRTLFSVLVPRVNHYLFN